MATKMQFTVYVLKSLKDHKFYTGFTTNLKKRIERHNSGMVESTKNRIPFILVYKEITTSSKEARKREKHLKSGCGREWLKGIINSEK